jgi:hypothetical protein
MNKNKNQQDVWKVVAVVISCIGLLFGTNLYQQITGRSIFASFQKPVQAAETPGFLRILDWGWNYYTDEDLNAKPNIIYCRQDVRLANPDAKSDLIMSFSSTIKYSGLNIPIDAQGESSQIYQGPDMHFSCIGVSLLESTPIPHPPYVIPEVPIPTSTLDPDNPLGEFVIDPTVPPDVSVCSANPEEYYNRFYLESSPATMPPEIKNELVLDFYILTTFYLVPDRYKYASFDNGGFSPVMISHVLTSISGYSIPLPEYTCFFYK